MGIDSEFSQSGNPETCIYLELHIPAHRSGRGKLYRNANKVRYLDLLGVHNFCIAAMVATLTISFDEQPLDKSWTGFFNP